MADIKDRAREYLRGQTQLNGGGLFHCNILNLMLGFAEQETKELEKENAELKNERNAFKLYSDGAELDAINLNEQLAKAKDIMNIAIEGIKYWGIVGGTERPFTVQAEKLFNLFLDEVEKFMKEE